MIYQIFYYKSFILEDKTVQMIPNIKTSEIAI